MKKLIADEAAVNTLLDGLAQEIIRRHPQATAYCLTGIKTRGAYMARRIQDRITKLTGQTPTLGELDITFYRDDLTLVAADPQLNSAVLGSDINGKVVILIDDVLYSGRTVLCAVNALARFGRPKRVEFMSLVDRGFHCLPICADYAALNVRTQADDIIHVHLKEKDGDDSIWHNVGGQLKRDA